MNSATHGKMCSALDAYDPYVVPKHLQAMCVVTYTPTDCVCGNVHTYRLCVW